MRPTSLFFNYNAAYVVSAGLRASPALLRGIVKDPNGRPIKGADVRIEAKNFSKIVKRSEERRVGKECRTLWSTDVSRDIDRSVTASLPDINKKLDYAARLKLTITQNTVVAK